MEPSLLQFVLLSMLLHMLVILLFGTTIRQRAARDGMLGSLDVTLRQLSPSADQIHSGAGRRHERAGRGTAPSLEGAANARPRPTRAHRSRTHGTGSAPRRSEHLRPRRHRSRSGRLAVASAPAASRCRVRSQRAGGSRRAGHAIRDACAGARAGNRAARSLPPREVPLPPMAPLERLAPSKSNASSRRPSIAAREVPMAPVAPMEKVAAGKD